MRLHFLFLTWYPFCSLHWISGLNFSVLIGIEEIEEMRESSHIFQKVLMIRTESSIKFIVRWYWDWLVIVVHLHARPSEHTHIKIWCVFYFLANISIFFSPTCFSTFIPPILSWNHFSISLYFPSILSNHLYSFYIIL